MKVGGVLIEVQMPGADGPATVIVRPMKPTGVEELEEFSTLMCAAEYLTHLVATKSPAGYEKSLELVAQGAMTWRTRLAGGGPNGGAGPQQEPPR